MVFSSDWLIWASPPDAKSMNLETAMKIDKRILRELESNQLSIVSQRTRKHFVLTVANPFGVSGIIVLPKTPSDHRAQRNAIAQIRKTAISLA